MLIAWNNHKGYPSQATRTLFWLYIFLSVYEGNIKQKKGEKIKKLASYKQWLKHTREKGLPYNDNKNLKYRAKMKVEQTEIKVKYGSILGEKMGQFHYLIMWFQEKNCWGVAEGIK